MNKIELNNILNEYYKDIFEKQANFIGADLDLSGTNFSRANLNEADFSMANLNKADFSRANLNKADFSRANLNEANFSGAELNWTDFNGSDLSEANFDWADLRNANLRGANLYKASFYGASFYGADLRGAKNIPNYICPINCPQEGSFIGFKKAYAIVETSKLHQFVIVKLRIMNDAKRSSATTRKCRCDKAEVISITSINGNTEFKEAFSIHDNTFKYKIGEIVNVDDFDEDRWNECSTGIHFFITREEAVNF